MKKLVLFVLLCGLVQTGFSQRLQTPTLSPFTKISQEVGLTQIVLEYSRPSAKGRTIFGDLVPFDKVWRTGANASTKLTFTQDVKIGGTPAPANTYALYTIPNKDSWTIIVHKKTTMRSVAGNYKPEDDLFRFDVKPDKTAHFYETFTLQFGNLTSNSVDLILSWENTEVIIPIEVEVDKQIMTQMQEFLKTPETIPHRTYFEAAQYYLNNGKSLEEALGFINTALEKSKNNFRYGLLKSKIQYKAGAKKEAMKTIVEAEKWAKEANNANYMEQTRLFRESMQK